MCLATAQGLWGKALQVDKEITIRWRPTKDHSANRQTQCQLRELREDENQDVNFVFGLEERSPGSNADIDTPAVENAQSEARRASLRATLRAKNAALLVEQLTELDMQNILQGEASR